MGMFEAISLWIITGTVDLLAYLPRIPIISPLWSQQFPSKLVHDHDISKLQSPTYGKLETLSTKYLLHNTHESNACFSFILLSPTNYILLPMCRTLTTFGTVQKCEINNIVNSFNFFRHERFNKETYWRR